MFRIFSHLFITGQTEELNNQHSGRIELLIDNIHHYFIKVSEKNICFFMINFKVSRRAAILFKILSYSRTWFIKSFTIVPKGLLETVILPSETRAHFHLDAKVVADGHPFSLSVNTTHAHSRRFIIQALLKNVFNKDASLSGKS